MKPAGPESAGPSTGAPVAAANNEEESTGLPWLHTWRAVYAFVLGAFVLWVVLLYALSAWSA